VFALGVDQGVDQGFFPGQLGSRSAVLALFLRLCSSEYVFYHACRALQFSSRMDELEELLSDNRVWKERTVGIGLINAQQAWDWGCRWGRGVAAAVAASCLVHALLAGVPANLRWVHCSVSCCIVHRHCWHL
jgi:hypothetical protein